MHDRRKSLRKPVCCDSNSNLGKLLDGRASPLIRETVRPSRDIPFDDSAHPLWLFKHRAVGGVLKGVEPFHRGLERVEERLRFRQRHGVVVLAVHKVHRDGDTPDARRQVRRDDLVPQHAIR